VACQDVHPGEGVPGKQLVGKLSVTVQVSSAGVTMNPPPTTTSPTASSQVATAEQPSVKGQLMTAVFT
jgi:hypothetical protein